MSSTVGWSERAGGTNSFEAERPRLLGLAYRMTGSRTESEDLVQEVWLRWQAADQDSIRSLPAWLTTVTTRLAVDRLRSARHRRETYPGTWLPEPLVGGPGPEELAERSDSLTLGFLILLDRLTPVERAVFLLGDVLDVPYARIAEIVGRSEPACRQIASRARQRVRRPGDQPELRRPNAGEERLRLERLLVSVAAGDVDAVIGELAPDVVCLSDGGPHRRAARRPVVGAGRVARFLVNLCQRFPDMRVEPITVNGAPGVRLLIDGQLDSTLSVETGSEGITAIHLVRNPEKLRNLDSPLLLL